MFGKVIHGMEVLDKIECSPCSAETDRPLTDITIEDTVVLKNPFRDSIADLLMKEWKAIEAKEEAKKKWVDYGTKERTMGTSGVDTIGKYLKK